MFNSKNKVSTTVKNNSTIDTLIGEGCTITGGLSGTGTLKIDGAITGDIHWESDVIIDSTAICNGNIFCENAIVNGKINGNISCNGFLTIETLGKITGDIAAKNLIVKEGASFNGKCTMNKENAIEISQD